jgi:hypothetical protein
MEFSMIVCFGENSELKAELELESLLRRAQLVTFMGSTIEIWEGNIDLRYSIDGNALDTALRTLLSRGDINGYVFNLPAQHSASPELLLFTPLHFLIGAIEAAIENHLMSAVKAGIREEGLEDITFGCLE